MSREIKFRAFYKPKRKDAIPSGMYEAIGISNGAHIGYDSKKISRIKEVVLLYPKSKIQPHDYLHTVLLKEVRLMQFTGLEDKNGKEVWEGDIVRLFQNCGSGDQEYRQEIYFGSGAFHPTGPTTGIGDIEVIGNVYENPELLKNYD